MKEHRFVLVDEDFRHQGNSVPFYNYLYHELDLSDLNKKRKTVGHTYDLRFAKLFTQQEVDETVSQHANIKLVPYKFSDLLKIVQHHVMSDRLPKFSRKDFVEKMAKKHKCSVEAVREILGTNSPMGASDDYVVVDTRQICGKSAFFWCHDGSGYTIDYRMAARYPYEEALQIEKSRGTDKLYTYDDLLPLVELHVDAQDLATFRSPKEKRVFSHTFYHLEVRD